MKNENIKEVIISDGLLSAVFGVKCEFVDIRNNNIDFKADYRDAINSEFKAFIQTTSRYDGKIKPTTFVVNLDTFIKTGIEKWIKEQSAYMLEFKKIDDGFGWFYSCVGDAGNKFENDFKTKQEAEMAFLEWVQPPMFAEKLINTSTKFHPST